jgi:Putative restriction endonuclease
MTWQQVLEHPSLRHLPFKIELNRNGVIEMRPTTNQHGFYKVALAVQLQKRLPQDRCISRASIQTKHGVRVADLVWASEDFIRAHLDQDPLSVAPAICISITAISAKEIRQTVKWYLEAGAREVWFCTLQGQVSFYGKDGQLKQSLLAPEFPKFLEL